MTTNPNSSPLGPERLTLSIDGMTCGHCQAAVAKAIRECGGVRSVDVSLKNGQAVVEGANLDSQRIVDVIQLLGYKVTIL